MTKRALITGITGQDGSYLAEFLLGKGYEVHGIIRRASSFNTQRIDHLYSNHEIMDKKLFLHYGDLTDGVSITNLVRKIEPQEIYNLGAQSHVMVSFSVPEFTAQVDAIGAIRFLEAIRASALPIRFYQASTSELFGSTPPPQSEESKFQPRSPYAAAKLYAFWVTRNYREAYGIHATNGILFNHESPRRGDTFVTKKIVRGVVKLLPVGGSSWFSETSNQLGIGGYAPEYVESMWKMLQLDTPNDYVVATGVGATVRDFLDEAFKFVGLKWQDFVKVDSKYLRPTEVDALIGDPRKANTELGWVAQTHWSDLVKIMVRHELDSLIT